MNTSTPAAVLSGIEKDVEAACASWLAARRQISEGSRAKRAAEKKLEGLPAGRYGRATIASQPSNREVADLDAIAADYAERGLAMPMKACKAGLHIELAD